MSLKVLHTVASLSMGTSRFHLLDPLLPGRKEMQVVNAAQNMPENMPDERPFTWHAASAAARGSIGTMTAWSGITRSFAQSAETAIMATLAAKPEASSP